MTPEISEFSYGFALTNELVGWTALRVAPIFPSLIEEGRLGGGYDVNLAFPGAPLFLQFKRSDCMTRASAFEISKHGLSLDVPFFRFPITERRRSFQHTSLVALDDGYNQVFYAAPQFHTFGQINAVWAANEVAQRSLFIAPSQIGPINDDDRHYVSFDGRRAYVCSTPRGLHPIRISDLRQKLEARLDTDARPLRDQLPEWRASIRESITRAHALQETVDAAVEEAKREKAKAAVSAEDRVGIRYVTPKGAGQKLEDSDIGPPPGPALPVRPPRALSPEETTLRAISDDARRSFNVQLLVVQRHSGPDGNRP